MWTWCPLFSNIFSYHSCCWSIIFTGYVLSGRFRTHARVAVPTAWYCQNIKYSPPSEMKSSVSFWENLNPQLLRTVTETPWMMFGILPYDCYILFWMYEDPSTKWHSITPQETGSCIVSAVRCSSLSVTVTEGRKWTTLRPRGEFLRMVDVIVFDVPHYLPFILVPSTLMASFNLPKYLSLVKGYVYQS